MFQRIIDDVKDSTGKAVRRTSLALAAGLGLLITVSFLSAAVFIHMLDRYGPIEACLAVAAIFFGLSVILMLAYLISGRTGARAPEPKPEPARSPLSSALADPMLLATGLQIVRAIGIKRLLPILAIGGVALGMLASRGLSQEDADEGEDQPGDNAAG